MKAKTAEEAFLMSIGTLAGLEAALEEQRQKYSEGTELEQKAAYFLKLQCDLLEKACGLIRELMVRQ